MATPQRNHPTDAQLTDFSSGKLASAECAEIEKHLAECDTCCQLLKTLPDDTLVALLRLGQPATPGEPGEDLESRLAATLPPESDRVKGSARRSPHPRRGFQPGRVQLLFLLPGLSGFLISVWQPNRVGWFICGHFCLIVYYGTWPLLVFVGLMLEGVHC